MQWQPLKEINHEENAGKRFAIFRHARKKFMVGKLEWIKANPYDVLAGLCKDDWHWVNEYSSCMRAEEDDMVFPLPAVTVMEKY